MLSPLSALFFFVAHLKDDNHDTQDLSRNLTIDISLCCNSSHFTPLIVASMRGNVEVVERLLLVRSRSKHPKKSHDDRDRGGMTPLHWASLKGHVEVMEKLLKFRADVQAVDLGNNTALHMAAISGSPQAIELLLKSRSAVNAQNVEGDTALHLAVNKEDFDAVELLLRYGATPGIFNGMRKTPIDIATKLEKLALIRLLKAATEPPGIYRWEKYKGFMPEDAVFAGSDPAPYCSTSYVGRALVDGEHRPGRVCHGRCYTVPPAPGVNGSTTDFEVLCSNKVAWKVMLSFHEIPIEAIEVTDSSLNKTYIGRGFAKDSSQHFYMLPGQVSGNKLTLSYNGKVYPRLSNFEILIVYK